MRTRSYLQSAMLLTAANVCLRLCSMVFQVWLTRKVGAGGIGLLQLMLTVGMFAVTLGTSGVRVASMYLCAEELGMRRSGGVRTVMRVCLLYALLTGTAAALLLWCLSPWLAEVWLENRAAIPGLRIFAVFLPATCLASVLSGYFTACSKVGRLVAVECGERLFSIGLTVFLLGRISLTPGNACAAILFGSCASGALSAGVLAFLYRVDVRNLAPAADIHPIRRVLQMSIPLAGNEYLRALLSTLEHLLIPRGLERHGATGDASIAAYGVIHGMVFPVITFPSAVLFAIADLLVPELARCHAAGRRTRTKSLSQRSLRLGLCFSGAAAGFLFACAEPLGLLLFRNPEAGRYIRAFAPLVPMLYMDTIVDAALKGLGEQVASVRYNTITSTLDVVLLLVLLPKYGILGYYLCFFLTHAVNFFLSAQRMCRTSGADFPFLDALRTLGLLAAACAAVCLGFRTGAPAWVLLCSRGGGFLALCALALPLCGETTRTDLRWVGRRIKARGSD